MEPSERALLGSSVFIMGLDDEEQTKINETSSIDYIMLSIVESIGSPNFQHIYYTGINDIKSESIQMQREFCRRILDRIDELYSFEFLNLSLDNDSDINNVYSFLEFLEFDHLDFISSIWKFFDVDIRKINISKVCYEKSDKIINEIEEQIDLHILSEMTGEFLRTYSKYGLIKWFINKSEKLKIEITLILNERRKNYGRNN